MRREIPSYLSIFCVFALVFGQVSPLLSQPVSIQGQMSGRVFDKDARTPVSGVTVTAQRVTTNEFFKSVETSALGNYLISDVPAGIYAFSLDHQGTAYPVEGRFDIRAGMTFLFESCFVLDRDSQTAQLRSECSSGMYAEAQVVSLGPHKFFRAGSPGGLSPAIGQDEMEVVHSGLECIIRDEYSIVTADFQPQERFRVGRVYFRAAQHPDFYYVEFVDTGAGLQAILPKPAPDTTQVVYYVEGTDLEFNPSLGPEYTPDVTDHETCKRRDPAAIYFTGGEPVIAVGATVAGAASVPAGFLPAGIATFISTSGTVTAAAVGGAAAGGGLSTTTLVIIIAGVGAGVTAAAIALTGDDEASPR